MSLYLIKNNEAGSLSIELVLIVIMLVLIGKYVFSQLDLQAGNLVSDLIIAEQTLPSFSDGE
jgi:hypothetical protein